MFTARDGKVNEENVHYALSESVSFCKRYDRNILFVFWFAVPTTVHLQNTNANFHKVV